jgi:uncharacterized LabA/DUF88 family protein
MKILVIADVSNLYHCIRKQFGPDRKLDYKKFLDNCREHGEIYRAIAYGGYIGAGADPFVAYLKHCDWEPSFKETKIFFDRQGRETRKADWDVGITVDAIRILENVDIVILGSADSDFLPLVQYIQQRGKRCYVHACRISRDLRDSANGYREVHIDDLEEKSNETPDDAQA